MLLLGVLCLTAGVFAHPQLLSTRSELELEYPWSFSYYPLIVESEAEKVPGVPQPPKLEPIPLVRSFEIEQKSEELKEEELKPDQGKDEIKEDGKEGEKLEEKEEEKEIEREEIKPEEIKPAEEPKQPVIVNLEVPKVPEFITNMWSNFPIKFPHINFPFTLSSIFGKPPIAETARYRIAYDWPAYVTSSRIRLVEKNN